MVFLVVLVLAVAAGCSAGFGFEDSAEFHLGTRAPYRVVSAKSYNEVKYDGCEQGKLWMYIRHGTRNPDEKIINYMKTGLEGLRDEILANNASLTYDDLKVLRKWKPPKFGAKDASKLTKEGKYEMMDLADRMRMRFPQILNLPYSEQYVDFKSTDKQRTKASAESFTRGLYGKKSKDVNITESKNDTVLRFYKSCKKWNKEIKNNVEAVAEFEKYIVGNNVTNVLRSVEQRLGLETNKLTYENLKQIYKICGYETAWRDKRKSPWCAAFDLEAIKVMEFAEDLERYWVDGYGHDISYKQACPAFDDMFAFLSSTTQEPRAEFYFSHSEAILKLISHLGLYKDDDALSHSNRNDARQWRTSKIGTFGTNLAFVSYRCQDEQKVLLLHQERVVRFPSCPETDLCSLATLRKSYSDSIENCNLETLCKEDTNVIAEKV